MDVRAQAKCGLYSTHKQTGACLEHYSVGAGILHTIYEFMLDYSIKIT